MKQKKVIGLIIVLVAAMAGGYWFYQYNVEYTAHWENQTQLKNRAPASFLSDKDIQLYKDYFSYSTFGKYVFYDTDVNFWTNKDEDYLKHKARLALHDTFVKVFSGNAEDKSVAKLLQENLFSSFMKHFVKTLYVFKIFNGTFQIDIPFRPVIQRKLNFTNELSSNQLVQLENTGTSSDLFEEEPSLIESVSKADIPNDGHLYQYNGGNITIWFKVLDLTWDPSQPVPAPKRNAVKGYIRYRRYFRYQHLPTFSPGFSKNGFSLDSVMFQKEKKAKGRFITVDVVKSFNLENFIPKLDYMDIHFGKIVPSNIDRDSITGDIIGTLTNEHKLKSGKFYLFGKYDDGHKKVSYTTTLKSLNYSFEEKAFTRKSKTFIRIDQGNDYDSSDRGNFEFAVRENLLNKYAHELIKELRLERFHKELKNTGLE